MSVRSRRVMQDDKGAEPESPATLSHDNLPSLTLDEIFAQLYSAYPHQVARDASRDERKAHGYISLSLVYGEIAIQPFRTVIDQLKRTNLALNKPGGVFLDVGSGSGKAVFAAALAHDFDACVGIEILDGLHAISQDVVGVWEKKLKKQFAIPMQKKRTRIGFIHGDALEVDWPVNPSADLVFMNSTCFTQSLLKELTKRLSAYCKAGSVVITATHPLPDTQNFNLLRSMTVEQEAWGDATWFVHRKK